MANSALTAARRPEDFTPAEDGAIGSDAMALKLNG
jgi:hypothetical protein